MAQRKQDAKGKWSIAYLKRSPEELKQIEQVAQAAIGVDNQRGDIVTVQEMAFDRGDAMEIAPPSVMDRARKGLSDFSSEVRYAMLLVMFAMAYFLMIRPMQKQILAVGVPAALAGAGAAATGELPQSHHESLPEPQEDTPSVATLKDQLLKRVKAEPTSSARAVQTWLREEAE